MKSIFPKLLLSILFSPFLLQLLTVSFMNGAGPTEVAFTMNPDY